MMGKLLSALVCVCFFYAHSLAAQSQKTHYLPAEKPSGLPLVESNDNKVAAGEVIKEIVHINMDLVLSDFRPETPDRPGLSVWAFREDGGRPKIPAPLIRVETGQMINMTFNNTHPDSLVYLFGFNERDGTGSNEPIIFKPGETKNWSFNAGKAGTYLYYAEIGIRSEGRFKEREQLAGAFIIDPENYEGNDEIIVLNIYSTSYDSTYEYGFLEALTMNGRSWPFSETYKAQVGDSLTWRVINASRRNHPMHLHGFYYDVISRGETTKDEIYTPDNVRKVVTEFMTGRTTMVAEWVPTREGKWVFHCHLSFHVSPEIRLPEAEENDEHHVHMAGLVVGIDVQPGETDLISKGETRKMNMYVNEYDDNEAHKYGFTLDEGMNSENIEVSRPGPLLLMKQYETTEVTVTNNMSQSTGVHWHGLELDSWADGVPNFSASGGKMSPAIAPGESFTYKLSHMRPGTFIYHSHLNDIDQITGGLYGPLLVLPEDEVYDPETDHVYILQWRKDIPSGPGEVDVNGVTFDKPLQSMTTTAGMEHRLRLINIAPAGRIMLKVMKDSVEVPIQLWAKDGADVPASQQVMVTESQRIGVGETIDYYFKPTEPGEYQLMVGYNDQASSKQTWIVEKN
ncbi:multicopper oxidase domain-containing protein [Balneola sp. MJW-20]|uniref:multicopper oxidase domain-containing protein n=1 Tax=Gracilimonas aurantiaca TaxID=3234185 RepID=UPI003467B97B